MDFSEPTQQQLIYVLDKVFEIIPIRTKIVLPNSWLYFKKSFSNLINFNSGVDQVMIRAAGDIFFIVKDKKSYLETRKLIEMNFGLIDSLSEDKYFEVAIITIADFNMLIKNQIRINEALKRRKFEPHEG